MNSPANSMRTKKSLERREVKPPELPATAGSVEVADAYAEWLLSQRGTVDPTLDLEF